MSVDDRVLDELLELETAARKLVEEWDAEQPAHNSIGLALAVDRLRKLAGTPAEPRDPGDSQNDV